MALLLVLLGVLPSLIWLIFFLQEDKLHPEPKRLILYTFFAGAASTIFVLQGQIIINSWFASWGIHIYNIISLFALAAVEEIFKFGSAYLVVKDDEELDEPIDPMIYMITASLGFAAVENIASLVRATEGVVLSASSIETIILRFIGATLLHALSSGIVGYYWGKYLVYKINFWKQILKGLIVATLLHTIFNFFIIKFDTATVAILFLVFVGFIVLTDFEKLKHPA